jgi:hypothetical protein
MTSPTYNAFVGSGAIGPARPTAEGHFGGLQFQDNPSRPPKDRERISSTDYMGAEMALECVCRMVPVLTVDFTPHETTPVVNYVTSTNSALTTATVTITRISVGVFDIGWTSGSLPPRTRRCTAHDGSTSSSYEVRATQTAANTVRVRCYWTGSLTDDGPLPCVEIYGE